MKAYGIPRNREVESPDVADIRYYGLNFSAGGKDYFKNKKNKKAIRRIWKKKARNLNKTLCVE